MDIRNTRSLKTFAAERTQNAPQEKKIVLIYSGLTIGLAALATLIIFLLDLRIDQTGGLSQMGTRTILSALQSTLSLLHPLAMLCLEVGYLAAMLRIARGQYASPRTLKLGFDRFWILVRVLLIQILIFGGIAFGCVYMASMIFVMSPWGQPFMELVTPMMAEISVLNPQFVLEEAMYFQVVKTMLPMFAITAIVFAFFGLPLVYQFRMVTYVIIDKPGLSAWQVIGMSRRMMRGNCRKLLRLDLSYWWYYLILLVVALVSEAHSVLVLLGVTLPFADTTVFFLFYGAYLALTFAAYYFLRNKVEVTYALFYDAVKPEEPKTDGVVLGNIFRM